MADLPRLRLFLFPWELASIPEYSTTLPTGTTLGKFWKRNFNVFKREAEPLWVVCAYSENADPKLVTIVHFDVVLRAGPDSRRYRAPDWSNYQQWQRERRESRNG